MKNGFETINMVYLCEIDIPKSSMLYVLGLGLRTMNDKDENRISNDE